MSKRNPPGIVKGQRPPSFRQIVIAKKIAETKKHVALLKKVAKPPFCEIHSKLRMLPYVQHWGDKFPIFFCYKGENFYCPKCKKAIIKIYERNKRERVLRIKLTGGIEIRSPLYTAMGLTKKG